MKSFSVENIKSFKNKTEIEVKPITILVGKNSCGKSSLIRFPAVLAQTGDDFSSPLQLYGKMIDYGSFNDIVFDHNGNEISFSLKYDFAVNGKEGIRYSKYYDEAKLDVKSMEIETHLGLINNQLAITNQKLVFDDKCVYEYLFGENGNTFRIYCEYNSENRSFDEVNYEISGLEGSVFDFLMTFPSNKDIKNAIKNAYFSHNDFPYEDYHRKSMIEDLLYRKTDDESIMKIRAMIRESSDKTTISEEEMIDALKSIRNESSHALEQNGENEDINSAYIDMISHELNRLLEAELKEQSAESKYTLEEIKFWHIYNCFKYFADLIYEIQRLWAKEHLRLSYMGPFRKEPERIYRYSGTQPGRVGSKGEFVDNVLFFDFQNNQRKTIDKVSEWLDKTLGYKLIIESVTNDYYQILLEDKNGIKSKITDVGYGISQILPIVTQIMINKPFKKYEYYDSFANEITIIEQPELHLHPAAQAELAGLFAACVSENKTRRLLIETHSEHFIRKLQVLIADKNCELTADDVAIYYVDKNENGEAFIDKLNILPNGQFEKEWPKGFFDKAFELTMELIKNNSEE